MEKMVAAGAFLRRSFRIFLPLLFPEPDARGVFRYHSRRPFLSSLSYIHAQKEKEMGSWSFARAYCAWRSFVHIPEFPSYSNNSREQGASPRVRRTDRPDEAVDVAIRMGRTQGAASLRLGTGKFQHGLR